MLEKKTTPEHLFNVLGHMLLPLLIGISCPKFSFQYCAILWACTNDSELSRKTGVGKNDVSRLRVLIG